VKLFRYCLFIVRGRPKPLCQISGEISPRYSRELSLTYSRHYKNWSISNNENKGKSPLIIYYSIIYFLYVIFTCF